MKYSAQIMLKFEQHIERNVSFKCAEFSNDILRNNNVKRRKCLKNTLFFVVRLTVCRRELEQFIYHYRAGIYVD